MYGMTKLQWLAICTLASISLSFNATDTPPKVDSNAPTDGCCAKCIGKPSTIPYTYDPVIHEECSKVSGVCCYNCSGEGDSRPDVISAKAFGNDGMTPQVSNKQWIQIAWTGIDRVTYEFYANSQKKVTTVRNTSTEARKKDGYFFICAARGEGKFVVRGWGKNACTSATEESTILVVPSSGKGGDECSENSADGALSEMLDSQEISGTCNLQRASWETTADGKKKCVCTSDWRGPPTCSGFPWWKIAATIGGGVAALLSIAVSIRAFLTSRRNKRNARKEEESFSRNSSFSYDESLTYPSSKDDARFHGQKECSL